MPVWTRLIPGLPFEFHFSIFFFFFFPACVNSSCTVYAHGFIVQETKSAVHKTYKHFFQKKIYIKNGSQGTIHTFKNYFAIVFSLFSFQQNKLYLNGPYIFWKSNNWLHVFYILNTHAQFCDNRILFTIWCINLFLIHNFKLQKLAM